MSPIQVKQYLQARGSAPMSDLVNRFDCDAGAILGILDFWIRKGKVRTVAGQAGCATVCSGCSGGSCGTPELSSVYIWVEQNHRGESQ